MEHFAEKTINIDLHIHSYASFYKDGSIVDNSKIENIDILLKALETNNINMFAITDHNRFDYELYTKLNEKIKENKIVKKNLPGIEFDVQLDENLPKCHIIAIFDDSDFTKLQNIPKVIKDYKELSKDESYTMDEFEILIKKIGLKTILIVHQKQSLDNKTGKTDSLSAACDDPSFFLKTCYIDSLEFGSNRTEGIVKNSLNDLNIDFPLITGSDCHDWNSYPYRDKNNKIDRKFTSLKCLPTFKGLLMAISSFNSRANRNENHNSYYIENIKVGEKMYPLVNGINAIIGDNGSGKTMLLNLLCNGKIRYYDDLVKENKLAFNYNKKDFQKNYIEYISQGEIKDKVKDGMLFSGSSDYYNEISTKATFSLNITDYFSKLHKYVMQNISVNESRDKLKNKSISVIPVKGNFYLPNINSAIDLLDISEDNERKNKLNNAISTLKGEFNNNKDYYKKLMLEDKINFTIKELDDIYKNIENNYLLKEKDNKVRSIITKHLNNYETSLSTRRTSDEKEKKQLLNNYNDFKKSIIDFIKLENKDNIFPEFPKRITGSSIKQKSGYEFTKKALYHNSDLKDEFYKYCFNNEYSTEKAIKKIDTEDSYLKALKNCSSMKEIEKYKIQRIQGFINEYSKENTFISEVQSKTIVGNTPGEISLVYYKFQIQEQESDFYVLAIDQPEDDINPKRINKFLLKILSNIRDKKQVLIVTHNPMLVVNLDVDNVIYLNKVNNKLDIKYGALEYDEDYSILDLIKDNLDGGYAAIEGRLKKYDKDNN